MFAPLKPQELDHESLAPVMKSFREKLMTKNVASEIADRMCQSVEESLLGHKLGTFQSFVLHCLFWMSRSLSTPTSLSRSGGIHVDGLHNNSSNRESNGGTKCYDRRMQENFDPSSGHEHFTRDLSRQRGGSSLQHCVCGCEWSWQVYLLGKGASPCLCVLHGGHLHRETYMPSRRQ